MSWFNFVSRNKGVVNGMDVSGGFPPDPSQFLNSKDDRVIVLSQPGEYKIPQEFKGKVTFVTLGMGATKVVIEGRVEGDLEVGHGDATVTGGVGKRVEAGQGNIRVEGNVQGNATSGQGNVEVKGDVAGDAETSMGNITVHGKLGGKAQSTMGRVVR